MVAQWFGPHGLLHPDGSSNWSRFRRTAGRIGNSRSSLALALRATGCSAIVTRSSGTFCVLRPPMHCLDDEPPGICRHRWPISRPQGWGPVPRQRRLCNGGFSWTMPARPRRHAWPRCSDWIRWRSCTAHRLTRSPLIWPQREPWCAGSGRGPVPLRPGGLGAGIALNSFTICYSYKTNRNHHG